MAIPGSKVFADINLKPVTDPVGYSNRSTTCGTDSCEVQWDRTLQPGAGYGKLECGKAN